MALSERPSRPDPATGLTRPGQTENQNPATMYQPPPAEGVQLPTPRLGRGAYVTGYGREGGPMAQQYGQPNVPSQGLTAPALGRGERDTAMTGATMPSGNTLSDFDGRPGASAAENRRDVISGVLETVRRNGGRPADLG